MSRYQWACGHPGIDKVRSAIAPDRAAVTSHPLYHRLDTVDAVATFAAHHVYAVWDFMSLLKSLQQELTGVGVPWVPRGSAVSRRLINDIVLVEESDDIDGEFISHFELYRRGMLELGVDTAPLDAFVDLVRSGADPVPALGSAGAPAAVVPFVATTWEIVTTLPVHARAAAFAFGREDLIPAMFTQVVSAASGRAPTFEVYLSRHIQVDEEEHTPMAMQMLIDLCGDEGSRWDDCASAARMALQARLAFWDAILAAIG